MVPEYRPYCAKLVTREKAYVAVRAERLFWDPGGADAPGAPRTSFDTTAGAWAGAELPTASEASTSAVPGPDQTIRET